MISTQPKIELIDVDERERDAAAPRPPRPRPITGTFDPKSAERTLLERKRAAGKRRRRVRGRR